MKQETSSTSKLRPPIVVILGHVDHGKTTLLDFIRKTRVQQKEAGGITQNIGASVVTTKEGKKITFIDTPGHSAFTNMRARGTKIADIAVLVVAATEGVKPQTKEALEFIITAKIPFIVAATKVDLPGASIDTVRQELEKESVVFEGRGGEVPLIGVSAVTGTGVDQLLEMVNLLSELNSVSGDKNSNLDAMVIETGKDNRGVLATVVVKNGTLRIGDEIVTQAEKAKVRGMFNYNKQSVKEVLPGEPALVLGFNSIPSVGSRIWRLSEKGGQIEKQDKSIAQIDNTAGKLILIIKAASSGSLEAIISNLPDGTSVVSSGVGDVNESDVFLARSLNSLIFAFEVKVPSQVAKLAETEGVKTYSFDIIYKLFEYLEELLKKDKVEILGVAQIIASFPYEDKKVAGCKITKGSITKGVTINLKHGEQLVGVARIVSMKKQKDDIGMAKQGEECGIIFVPQLDFTIGDVILSVRKN